MRRNETAQPAMGEPALDGKYNFIQSVGRAFAILEQFQDQRSLGVTAIANRVGLHKSTCFGLLHTLHELGYVQQDPENGHYSLGLKSFELGQAYIVGLDLRTLVKPYLSEMLDKVHETVHLVIAEGHRAVYIDKVEAPHAMTISSRIGQEAPLHCTGVGKALLAFMPEEECQAVLSEGLKHYTEQTLTDPVRLKEHLKEIRRDGFAIDDEEREMGLRCVAAPIFNARRQVIAALSISGPATRISTEKVGELAQMLKAATQDISRKLGYRL